MKQLSIENQTVEQLSLHLKERGGWFLCKYYNSIGKCDNSRLDFYRNCFKKYFAISEMLRHVKFGRIIASKHCQDCHNEEIHQDLMVNTYRTYGRLIALCRDGFRYKDLQE